jgi:hypothetical protein
MQLEHIRAEIERMRVQVGRQRKDILKLQRAGIDTASAELLLGLMQAKIEALCTERDRLRKEQGGPVKGKAPAARGRRRTRRRPQPPYDSPRSVNLFYFAAIAITWAGIASQLLEMGSAWGALSRDYCPPAIVVK